jgi:hypothetical protein
MIRLLSKLLDIRSNEWPRASLLYAIIFLATTGIIWGETIVSASFLNQIGVDFLPWFFVAKALISLPATMAYAAFADRVPNDWLLMAILGVAIAGIAVGLLPYRLAYPLARLEPFGFFIVLGLVFLLPSLLRTLGIAFDPAYWLIAVPSNAIIRVIASALGLA